jgi:hypothetical protein
MLNAFERDGPAAMLSKRRSLERFGKRAAFYSNKHSVFRANQTGATGGTGLTHFGRRSMCSRRASFMRVWSLSPPRTRPRNHLMMSEFRQANGDPLFVALDDGAALAVGEIIPVAHGFSPARSADARQASPSGPNMGSSVMRMVCCCSGCAYTTSSKRPALVPW